MPLMEYHCKICNSVFEKIVKSTGEEVTCPACGAVNEIEKVMTTSSFHLKGPGWAKDLYGGGKA